MAKISPAPPSRCCAPCQCGGAWGCSWPGWALTGSCWSENFVRGYPPDRVCPGGPSKVLPGVPPSAARRARGRVGWTCWWPGWALTGSGRCAENFARCSPLDCVCLGGPANVFPGFPPSATRHAREGGPDQSGGSGGRLLGWGGVPNCFRGVPPLDCVCPGGLAIFLPGFPPSAARHARGEDSGRAGGPDGHSLGRVGWRSVSLVPGREESSSGEGGAAKLLR